MKTIKKTTQIIVTAWMLAACSKPEQSVAPFIGNETLTNVILKLVNQANPADSVKCEWYQLLSPTGTPLPADTLHAFLNLKRNSVYTGYILILDSTQTPATDVSLEIYDRRNYHLFYYQPTPVAPTNLVISDTTANIPGTPTSPTGPYLQLVVKRSDYDSNTPPLQVGLNTVWTTGAASSGRLRVVLRHQPNAKNGTYSPGSSDLDVNYTININ